MKKFNGNHYGSTYETAHIILNSLWIFEQEAKDHHQSFPFDFVVSGNKVSPEQIKISYFHLDGP